MKLMQILFLRHTLAPGFGDPQNFNIENCNTQRNLNEEGRYQAKIIGNVFKKNNLIFLRFFQVNGVDVKKLQIY